MEGINALEFTRVNRVHFQARREGGQEMILSARFLRNPSILGELPENRLTFAGMAIKDGLAKKNKKTEFAGLQAGFFFIETRTHSMDFSSVASFFTRLRIWGY